MTNIEKIKAMSTEEMARKLQRQWECFSCPIANYCITSPILGCSEVIKEWLESEVKEDG